jgi:hypothetical protein
VRSDINFSINGGSTFNLEDNGRLFYEGSFYSADLNDPLSFNGLDRASANDNVDIFLSPETSKNKDLVYFNEDGSSSSAPFVSSLNYVPANSGVRIPDLLPGDFFGIYLRFNVRFSIDSLPVDYAFLNLSYNNTPVDTEEEEFNFGFRENIPGKSFGKNDFIQSFAFKFLTRLNYFVPELGVLINKIYDNYPPFFNDYRETNNL